MHYEIGFSKHALQMSFPLHKIYYGKSFSECVFFLHFLFSSFTFLLFFFLCSDGDGGSNGDKYGGAMKVFEFFFSLLHKRS